MIEKGNKNRKTSKRRGRGHMPRDIKAIAYRRIDTLFEIATKAALCHEFDWSRKYVSMAKKVGMRATIGIPQRWRPYYCRKCLSFLLPPHTAEVRIKKGRVIKKCLNCGTIRRVPLHK